jgi:hypothetical protein
MRTRINRLENSILSMISGDIDGSKGSKLNKNPPLSPVDDEEVPDHQKLSIDSRSTHWNVVLNEVSLLEDYCGRYYLIIFSLVR